MKQSYKNLLKLPAHPVMRVLTVLFAAVGLAGLSASLTHADLQIQSSLDNVLQTIQGLHVTSDGTSLTSDTVRLDQSGVYISTGVLGGTAAGILKVNSLGYVYRDLITSGNISTGAITTTEILDGTIQFQDLGFTLNTGNVTLTCPAGQVLYGILSGSAQCITAGTTPTSGNCGGTGYVMGWSATGALICSNGGTAISMSGASLWHLSGGTNDIFRGTWADDNNGNVGVGLDSPLAKLHVTPVFRVDMGTSGYLFASGARVGVNTLFPAANLDIVGTVRFGSYAGVGTRYLGVDTNGDVVIVTAPGGGGAGAGSLWGLNGSDIYYNGGYVGIGTASPSDKLQVIGDVRADNYYYNSDSALKTNIVPISSDEALQNILQLRGYTFNWIANNSPGMGVIAQDVRAIYPDIVHTDENGFLSVQYASLIAPIIESVKQLNANIEAVQTQYGANAELLSNLSQRVTALEQRR